MKAERYTAAERKAMADALRSVKPRMWEGQLRMRGHREKFICFALHSAWEDGQVHRTAHDALVQLINGRLAGLYTVEMWLLHNVPAAKGATEPQIQAYRLAWIDALIMELDPKGTV